jgi:hypothetical protein
MKKAIVTCCRHLLRYNITKKEGNNSLLQHNQNEKGDDNLLSSPFSLQQNQKEEGNDNNCHCLLHYNRTKEKGDNNNFRHLLRCNIIKKKKAMLVIVVTFFVTTERKEGRR